MAASNFWKPQGLYRPIIVFYLFLLQCMETSAVVIVKALSLTSLGIIFYDIVTVSFLLISKNYCLN